MRILGLGSNSASESLSKRLPNISGMIEEAKSSERYILEMLQDIDKQVEAIEYACQKYPTIIPIKNDLKIRLNSLKTTFKNISHKIPSNDRIFERTFHRLDSLDLNIFTSSESFLHVLKEIKPFIEQSRRDLMREVEALKHFVNQ
jgi:hypothetical protein